MVHLKDDRKAVKSSRRKVSLTAENKKKIISLFESGDPIVSIAKKLERNRHTISKFLNSEEGKNLLSVKENEIKREKLLEEKEQHAKDLLNKFFMGTITPIELDELKEEVHSETLQGQAEQIAKKVLVESLGKSYADAILKKFVDNVELLNKIDSWRAYYEPIAIERGGTFIGFAEEALQYAVDTIREDERKKKEEITMDDMIGYIIALKMLKSM